MIEIIPAIMPTSYADLVAKADKVKGNAQLAQIDVMDGKFVKSKSWPYREAGNANDAHFLAMGKQDEMLPHFDELDYELDLMIDEPEKHIDEWLPLGASRLIFHFEAIKNREEFFTHAIFQAGAREIGGSKVIEIGLAINPDTSLSEIEMYMDNVDFVQCMGIAKVGYQGEPFDERALLHINALRVKYPNMPIAVDGGVSLATAHDLKAAGATRLVSGSAVFSAEDMSVAIEGLRNA